jgi:hypothetical protein
MSELENILPGTLTESQKINFKIIQSLTSINTAINDIRHDVDVHNKLLVTGNGEVALMERVRNLEAFVGGMRYWLRLVAGALMAQTITFGVAAVIYFIKLTPILERIAQQP